MIRNNLFSAVGITILVIISLAPKRLAGYTIYCGSIFTLGVDMEDTKNKQIVKYSPISPSVLLHRMRMDLSGRWDQSKMVKSVRQWLRPPKRKATVSKRQKPVQSSVGLIIPDAHDPFMLLAKSDPMSNLLAENHRLRGLIDELVREDSRVRLPEYRH